MEVVWPFFLSFTAVSRKVVPQKLTYATMPKGVIDSVSLPTVNRNSQCFTLIKGKVYNECLKR